jgi:hypothetical protein
MRPAANALIHAHRVAGLLHGFGERDQDAAMIYAGERLAIRSVLAGGSSAAE